MPAAPLAAVGFVAGVFAGLSLSWAAWPLGSFVAIGAAVLWRVRPPWALLLAAAAAGALFGTAASRQAAADCRRRFGEGEAVSLVLEPWDVTAPGRRGRAHVLAPTHCRGEIAVVWPRGVATPRGVAAVSGTWHRTSPRGPTWWPSRPAHQGRLVLRHARSFRRPVSARAGLRLSAERRVAALFGPHREALATALTMGSGDRLDPELRARFARAGLAHILAISGLHVGILAVAVLVVLRAARVPKGLARLAGAVLVAGYVWVLGFPAPALRSAGLLALWQWAYARQRPPVRGALLAAAGLLVAAADPFAVAEAGPWLSFAGVWGCMTAARRWREVTQAHPRLGERRWRVLGLVTVSFGATLATAPISALAFGTVAPAAIVANLAAIPVAGFVVPSLALALLLGPTGLTILTEGAAAASGLGLDALDWITHLAGELPLASLTLERRALSAGFLGVLAWLALRPLPRSHSRRDHPLAIRLCVAAAALACGAVWSSLVPRTESGYKVGWLTLHFLAVGQGDAAVARTPAGRWVVIDGGPRTRGFDAGAAVVVPFLRRNGARRLAVVAASHGDADHLGGLPAVLRAMPADLALEPGEPLWRSLYRSWLSWVQRSGARWRRARAGEHFSLDGVRIAVFHPDSAWLERRLPANENSLVIGVEFGRFRALFPGDAGLPMEGARAPAAGRVTLLKVAHHGSRTATGETWLAALRPRICVISVGPNRYGHPDPSTLARLAARGCTVYRTDAAGPVRVETDGDTVIVAVAGRRDTALLSMKEQP